MYSDFFRRYAWHFARNLDSLALLAVLYILFSTLIKIHPNKLRSIITFAIFGVACAVICSVLNMFNVAAGCLTIAIIAIVKHIMAKENEAVAEVTEEVQNGDAQNNAVA